MASGPPSASRNGPLTALFHGIHPDSRRSDPSVSIPAEQKLRAHEKGLASEDARPF